MITKIKIKNFKSIIDLEIDLNQGKTIFVGQNEAGKSSILEAIDAFEYDDSHRDNLNYDCEQNNDLTQVISVQYSCNTEQSEEFQKKFMKEFPKFFKDVDFSMQVLTLSLSRNINPKINKYTLTREFDFTGSEMVSRFSIDQTTINKLIEAHKGASISSSVESESISYHAKAFYEDTAVIEKLAQLFHNLSMEIIFFNDFSDILPDSIEVDKIYDNTKVEGKEAVKSIERLLNGSFKQLSTQKISLKKGNIEKSNKAITVDFLKDWKQKLDDINSLKIEFDIQKNEKGIDVVHFFIETKDGVKLEPRRRSQGLRWFLSLWLEIKAEAIERPVVLLFDEPGAYLHINAMKDMLGLFDNLVQLGNQIVYSTHLPSMIDVNCLEDIRLVVHDKDKGTQIEKLTASRFDTQVKRDALQPIAQAMGMQPLTEFSVLRQKNVIVEGLSDMLYLNAMKKVLSKSDEYAFVPGIGAKNEKLNSLISFCIGYGLDWLVLLDNGYHPTEFIKQLNKSLESQDDLETNPKIHVTEAKEIEDLFHLDDLKSLSIPLTGGAQKSVSELIGVKRKVILAQEFNNKVNNGQIVKASLKPTTIANFEKIFAWIETEFGISKKKS